MRKTYSSIDDDETLVNCFKSGDKAAFGFLIEKHSKYLSNLIYNLVKDPMLVEDIMQDTFIKAMDSIQAGKYQNENFKGWIARIAHNLTIDYFRYLNRRKTTPLTHRGYYGEKNYELDLGELNEISPEDEIINLEVQYDINQLIDFLPPDQKEIVTLRYFHNLTFREIVDYIGGDISINTCLGRMRYALINLQKAIKEIRSNGRKVFE